MKKTYLYSEVIYHDNGTETETIFRPNGTKVQEILYLNSNGGVQEVSHRACIVTNYDEEGVPVSIYEYKQKVSNENNLLKIKIFKRL